jgi:hypothetical protein
MQVIVGYRIATLVCTIFLTSCETRPREVYDIPADYRGWVEIRVNRSGCRPLTASRGEIHFVVPKDGRLCTSSPIAFGWGREEFNYVREGHRIRLDHSGAGSSRMIWQKEYYGSSGVGASHEGDRDRVRFFVGTKAEYEKVR